MIRIYHRELVFKNRILITVFAPPYGKRRELIGLSSRVVQQFKQCGVSILWIVVDTHNQRFDYGKQREDICGPVLYR